jgi:signal transduction protein with GAF and PtsI domain
MTDRLAEVLAEFTRTIVNPFDPDELLDQLIRHTLSVLEAGAAGLMLADTHGDLQFAAASGQKAAQMEKVQEGTQTGVCYHAFTTNQVVIANDLDDLQRWPIYTDRALELGFGSVLGVPLNASGQTIGVLNVYREEASVWTERDVELCEVLAAMGASYILSSSQLRAQHDIADSLQTALTSRVVIEQAKGILMATEDVDGTTAFETIRKASRDNNRKLRDVAQEIVDRHPCVQPGGSRRETNPDARSV